ncbi:unnamed protein product [Nyctereutes procyonoides]|uniref:(raccoon dog) hypothetical protein n=1 Tax=Nyctereutes procyonoides TaxID=34880 RepID=A0A811Z7L8_NYCPR|nr:unnamed protein product [Nyctereutes procyonoides]
MDLRKEHSSLKKKKKKKNIQLKIGQYRSIITIEIGKHYKAWIFLSILGLSPFQALGSAWSLLEIHHGPDSFASAAREMELFFPSSGVCGPANTAKFTNCTCCIIKPHAISEGLLGKILMAIWDAGFEISAMQMFNMDRVNVEEFYEVYKGVVSEAIFGKTKIQNAVHCTDLPDDGLLEVQYFFKILDN